MELVLLPRLEVAALRNPSIGMARVCAQPLRRMNGNRAEVRVVRDGLTRASGVTLVGNSALVLVDFTRAVIVPYRAR